MSDKQRERTLLVEGEDDKKFFTTLLKKDLKLEENDFIIEPPKATGEAYRNGINTLLKILPSRLAFVKSGVIRKLAIVIDADSDNFGFIHRRTQITDILKNHGYSINDLPNTTNTGEIFNHPDGFIVGLWIMPNHVNNGMFEDCLLETIHTTSQLALLATARDTIKNLGSQRLFIDKHISKAELSTWLAWQEDIGMSVGYAYHKGLFNKEHSNIQSLITWLQKVFA